MKYKKDQKFKIKHFKKVTIGILSFNSYETIMRAIEGALKQTWANKEVIVIDDNSTDNSFELIKGSKYKEQILVIRNDKNYGPGYSRNKILELAKGDFVCFMDDDDYSYPNRISKQIRAIYNAGYPENKYVISTCDILRKYKSGYTKKFFSMGTFGRYPVGNELADFLLFNSIKKGVDYGFACPTSSMLGTKESFSLAGNFDNNLRRVEDMDICIRLSIKGALFVSAKEFLIEQVSTQAEDKSPFKNFISEKKIIEKNKKYLEKKGLYKYCLLWTELRYYYFNKNFLLGIVSLSKLIFFKPIKASSQFLRSSLKRLIHEYKINFFS
ncbi:glycosyltransferase [Prochlorococcus sp. AH-736-M13]|nr:glycosyltransferase [Prochlorococcus sp. AH-736-M13]MDA9746858.1 glycosyltransferase [Prochlorococcus sp. AH-736-M13]